MGIAKWAQRVQLRIASPGHCRRNGAGWFWADVAAEGLVESSPWGAMRRNREWDFAASGRRVRR